MPKKVIEKLSQKERLEIVLDIVKKLKFYVATNGSVIDLYNDEYTFIQEFKKISNEYIKQDDYLALDYRGLLLFEEINKEIEYLLPASKNKTPLFVIRMKKLK
jgi:hypothetical protein